MKQAMGEFGDSVGSANIPVQPQNLGFQTRVHSGTHFAGTNFMSEGDFERANTDVEDDTQTEYYEEEVTDNEAMALAAKARADPDTEDSGDLGFYMPTLMAKSSPSRPPVQKITKKVRRKKIKPTKSSAKPAKKTLTGPADNGLGLDQRKASSLANPKLINSNPVLPGSTVSGGILKPAQS